MQLVLKQVQLVRRFAASMALLDGTQKQVQLVLEQVQWVRRFAASLSLAASLPSLSLAVARCPRCLSLSLADNVWSQTSCWRPIPLIPLQPLSQLLPQRAAKTQTTGNEAEKAKTQTQTVSLSRKRICE